MAEALGLLPGQAGRQAEPTPVVLFPAMWLQGLGSVQIRELSLTSSSVLGLELDTQGMEKRTTIERLMKRFGDTEIDDDNPM